MRLVGLAITILAACASSNSVVCGDRVCPAGSVCGHDMCLFEEQTTACAELVDGDVCLARDQPGICDDTFCIPGCGDDRKSAAEECDDGNFASHDGCSSACLLELPTWNAWDDPWKPRAAHGAAFDTNRQRLVIVGGFSVSEGHGDQWERDADGVWHWTKQTAMSARHFMAAAYDSARMRMVVFGGASFGEVLDETWLYDGVSWQQPSPSTSPSPRYAASMVFDSVQGVAVLFGGIEASTGRLLDETWEWNGTTWTKINGAAPPPRHFHSMTWDSVRNRVVLFGGVGTVYLNDLWEYSAGAWTNVTPAGALPASRYAAQLAFLPGPDKLVLFGGFTGAITASDTWHYDPTNKWVAQAPLSSPSGRLRATLTLDPTRNVLVLVGGDRVGTQDERDQVWEYDGTTWREQLRASVPAPRQTYATYDEVRRDIVIFGGNGLVHHDDTWTFGDVWLPRRTSARPAARGFSALVYDPARGRTVMFGGYGASALDDTWEWDRDGQQWIQLTTPVRPPARFAARLVRGPGNALVLYGGFDQVFEATKFADTWELVGSTWTQHTTLDGPPGQDYPSLAYDPHHDRVILLDHESTTWTYQDHTWSRLMTTAAPPPRRLGVMTFDPTRGRTVMCGGTTQVDGQRVGRTDCWELGDDAWHELPLIGERPAHRDVPAFAPYPPARALVMFGGAGPIDRLDDTWILRYISTTPDEECTNELDDDGDQKIDQVDPDCTF